MSDVQRRILQGTSQTCTPVLPVVANNPCNMVKIKSIHITPTEAIVMFENCTFQKVDLAAISGCETDDSALKALTEKLNKLDTEVLKKEHLVPVTDLNDEVIFQAIIKEIL